MTDEISMVFEVKDCSLITRMAGIPDAMNLRELEERISVCPVESLFHHFCETTIRATFDNPEYNNDFALWVRRYLSDRTLAERLGVINPYKCTSIEDLRTIVLDVIRERLGEIDYIPWAPRKGQFHFLRSVTVVYDTGMVLNEPLDLCNKIPEMAHGSLYYHFVEARRRTPDGRDDFTSWLEDFGESVNLLTEALHEIDFYFIPLSELKHKLIEVTQRTDILDALK